MVIFFPRHTSGECALEELSICDSLNKLNSTFRCLSSICQEVNTEVFVNKGNTEHIAFEVGNYCCENFKIKLRKFLPHNQ